MWQWIIALLGLLLSGINLLLFFFDKWVWNPVPYMVMSAIIGIIYIVSKFTTDNVGRKTDRLTMLVITFYLALAGGSLIQQHWTMEAIFTAETLSKIFLALLLVAGIYVNFVFFNAERAYKRKRGNQRIKEPPQKSPLQKWKERKESEKSQDVQLILGESADNEE